MKKKIAYGLQSKRLYSLLLILCMTAFQLHAQNSIVTGTIRDDKGSPLPDVTVSVKGTTVSTLTDANGKFSISMPATGTTLIFSHVNYGTKEEIINGRQNIDMAMSERGNNMEEVVIVGYGSQKKIDLTGAIATISGAELNKRIATDPTQLLQGKLAGLQLVQGSGEAGNENLILRVRGMGTYSGAGGAPLIIVDGVPGSLSALNANNIASITLLKDAASAAIYGTRAANGVILVTTKTGSGGFHLTYDYNVGHTKATALPELVYNSVEFMKLYNQAAVNSGAPAANRFSQATMDLYASGDPLKYPSVNWLDLVMRPVYVQNHYLGLNGGRNGTSFNVGLGFTDQPDIMIGFNYKKYNLQFNINSSINERISMGSSLTFNYAKRVYPRQGSQDQFLSTLSQSPLYGPKLPDGSGRYTSVAFPFQAPNKNPIAIAENAQANTTDYYMQGSAFVNVKLLQGLEWRTSGGINFLFQKTYDFRPQINQYFWNAGPNDAAHRLLDVGGQGLTVNDNSYIYPVAYTQLTYTKGFGDHNFKMLAGTQVEYNKTQGLSGVRLVYPSNSVRELNSGSTGAQSNTGTTSEWALRSYYGRLNYDFKEKYLLELNARFDASSRFPPNNRWAVFPSVSAGWRLSREKFLETVSWLSDLKLRASWGELGNQNIGTYPFQSIYNTGPSYPYTNSALSPGIVQNSLVDTSIKWETTRVLDIGLDIAILQNKLSFTFDWYKKETYDILGVATTPAYVGMTAPTVNIGRVENKGFEIGASFRDRIGAVSYNLGSNFQLNKNKLLKINATTSSNTNINLVGEPYGSFFLYEYLGIFQSAEEIAKSPTQPFSPQPGYMKFKDQNNDNKIDANDRIVFPGIFPKFDYSFNAGAEWKNFDLTIFLYGSHGQKIFVNGWGMQPFNQNSVPTTDWMNAWSPTNPSTTMPMIYITGTGNISQNAGTASTYYLKDASFMRLKNLQIGYTLPASISKKVAMSSLRIYFAGDNLITFSKFPGLDPERVAVNTRYVTHPQNRVLAFGVRAIF